MYFLFNPLNTKLNPICHLLALLGAYTILHVSRVRVNRTTLQVLLHSLQVLYMCTLCDSTNINTIIRVHSKLFVTCRQ
jgi:hypothetical protein